MFQPPFLDHEGIKINLMWKMEYWLCSAAVATVLLVLNYQLQIKLDLQGFQHRLVEPSEVLYANVSKRRPPWMESQHCLLLPELHPAKHHISRNWDQSLWVYMRLCAVYINTFGLSACQLTLLTTVSTSQTDMSQQFIMWTLKKQRFIEFVLGRGEGVKVLD